MNLKEEGKQSQTNDALIQRVRAISSRKYVVFGVIVLVTGALMLMYAFKHSNILSIKSELADFAVTIGPLDKSALFEVSADGKQITPLLENNADGVPSPVLDYIKHRDGSIDYILVTDPNEFITQVFTKNPNGSVVMQTNSPTFKYGLTVDQNFGVMAYLSAPITSVEALVKKRDWNVTILSNGREKVLSKGYEATLVKGTQEIVIATSKSLIIQEVGSEKQRELLPLLPGAKSSVDGDSRTVAVLNPVTNQTDIFSFKDSGSATYLRSVSTPAIPVAFTIKGEEPIVVYTGRNSDGGSNFQITNVVTNAVRAVDVSSNPFIVPSRIILTHD